MSAERFCASYWAISRSVAVAVLVVVFVVALAVAVEAMGWSARERRNGGSNSG